jgi:hypothetical protein
MRAPFLLAEAAGELLAHGLRGRASYLYQLASEFAQTPEGAAVLLEKSRLALHGQSEPDGHIVEARHAS